MKKFSISILVLVAAFFIFPFSSTTVSAQQRFSQPLSEFNNYGILTDSTTAREIASGKVRVDIDVRMLFPHTQHTNESHEEGVDNQDRIKIDRRVDGGNWEEIRNFSLYELNSVEDDEDQDSFADGSPVNEYTEEYQLQRSFIDDNAPAPAAAQDTQYRVRIIHRRTDCGGGFLGIGDSCGTTGESTQLYQDAFLTSEPPTLPSCGSAISELDGSRNAIATADTSKVYRGDARDTISIQPGEGQEEYFLGEASENTRYAVGQLENGLGSNSGISVEAFYEATGFSGVLQPGGGTSGGQGGGVGTADIEVETFDANMNAIDSASFTDNQVSTYSERQTQEMEIDASGARYVVVTTDVSAETRDGRSPEDIKMEAGISSLEVLGANCDSDPVARFDVSYQNGNSIGQLQATTLPDGTPGASETVNFDASESSDNAGYANPESLAYSWDFNNDGEFDATGMRTSRIFYETLSNRQVKLEVEDVDGNTDSTQRPVNIDGTNDPIARDDGNSDNPICTPADGTTNIPVTVNDINYNGDSSDLEITQIAGQSVSVGQIIDTGNASAKIIENEDGAQIISYRPISAGVTENFTYSIQDNAGRPVNDTEQASVYTSTTGDGCGIIRVNFENGAGDPTTASASPTWGNGNLATQRGSNLVWNKKLSSAAKLATLLNDPNPAAGVNPGYDSVISVGANSGYSVPQESGDAFDKSTFSYDGVPTDSGIYGGLESGESADENALTKSYLGTQRPLSCIPVRARFTYSGEDNTNAPLSVDASTSEGNNLSYAWTIGPQTGSGVSETFDLAPGTYNAELVVTDDENDVSSSATGQITIIN